MFSSDQLEDTETRLENKQHEVHTLHGQLETSRSEILQNAKKISSLEGKNFVCDIDHLCCTTCMHIFLSYMLSGFSF